MSGVTASSPIDFAAKRDSIAVIRLYGFSDGSLFKWGSKRKGYPEGGMKAVHNLMNERLQKNAGIAIGPILFIIAILAILAAAIAAGSGSFTSPTASESAKTKASAIIQLGDTLKMGLDRLTMENAVSWGNWVISVNETSGNNDLFSPTGGGISPPSISMAADPGNDVWYYPIAAVPGLGTPAPEQLAVLNVASDVCNEINNRAAGVLTPAGGDLGDFSSTSDLSPETSTNWPAALNGKTVGCVVNTHIGTRYYFYEVLYVQ